MTAKPDDYAIRNCTAQNKAYKFSFFSIKCAT